MAGAAQQAINAQNTLLKYGNGASPEVFTTIANVGNINGPQLNATIVDVTSHSTGVPWRQKQTTILDIGDLALDIFLDPNSTNHQQLLTYFQNRTIVDWALEFPEVGAPIYAFSGTISKFSITSKPGDVLHAAMTITGTGQPNFLAVVD